MKIESCIVNAMTIAVKFNVDGVEPDVIASRLDCELLEYLIEFINRHSHSFFSYNRSIQLEDLEEGHWGYYSHHRRQTVVINRSLVDGLSKRLVVGLGENILRQLVNTMLHEHRHCFQHRYCLLVTKVPYVTFDEDPDGYWNHPMEVDAREYADIYTQDALEYVYGKIKNKYVEPVLKKHRGSTI